MIYNYDIIVMKKGVIPRNYAGDNDLDSIIFAGLHQYIIIRNIK